MSVITNKSNSLRNILLFSALLYFTGIIAGVIMTKSYCCSLLQHSNNLSFLAKYVGIYSRNPREIGFSDILLNNLASVGAIILGSFTFGILTSIQLLLNGYLLGVLLSVFSDRLLTITLVLLPHGIFEITATVIAGAAGFKIPYEIARYLAGKKSQVLTKEDIREYLVLTIVSIILIVIAAWVEANITSRIAETVLSKM